MRAAQTKGNLKMTEKKAYVAPKLEDLGSFEALTNSTNDGRNFDASFNGKDLINGTSI